MADIFKNVADIEKKFRDQAYLVQRQLLQKAAKEGAELIRHRASELAPRDTGELAESEMIKVIAGESSAAEVVVRIGPAQSAFYGMFQEFGTDKMEAQPFLNPALEDMAEKAIEVSGQSVWEGLEKHG